MTNENQSIKTEKLENGDVLNGDSLSLLEHLPENKFHAVVTDPPYNYEDGFKQHDWDNIGTSTEYQKWCEDWANKVSKTLKPGGHLIAFSGNRTHHRLMSGIEDAEYEIRDTITWHYGEGFPKGSAIERWLDEEYKDQFGDWRAMLKPATEFAVLARSELDDSSSTQNQMKHGTGNLNVEKCRIGNGGGRFPANLILDEVMGQVIDLQSGKVGGPESKTKSTQYSQEDTIFFKGGRSSQNSYDDSGGASRFFYCPKATKPERTHNGKIENDHHTVKPVDLMKWLIKLVTDEGQWVLDPFAGSGTTLCAAEKSDRKSVGIEQSKEYAETARKRFGTTLIES